MFKVESHVKQERFHPAAAGAVKMEPHEVAEEVMTQLYHRPTGLQASEGAGEGTVQTEHWRYRDDLRPEDMENMYALPAQVPARSPPLPSSNLGPFEIVDLDEESNPETDPGAEVQLDRDRDDDQAAEQRALAIHMGQVSDF